MTRGRESNIAYVALDDADESHGRIPGEDVNVRDVLLKILANSGAEPSAHQVIRDEQETWGSIARMAAEYETIAAAGQHDRWATLVRASGLTGEQAEVAPILADPPERTSTPSPTVNIRRVLSGRFADHDSVTR